MQKSEKELISLAKSGDDYAFETLLSSYKNLVTGICRRYFLVGGDIDDLIQEGMIALFKAVKTYDETKNVSFSAYAKTIVERQIINEIKRANNKKNAALKDYVALNNQGGIQSENEDTYYILEAENFSIPENLMVSSDNIKQTLKQIKQALSTYELSVLELYLKGETYTSIAIKLNQSTKSIDNALNRIKNKLKFLKQN